MDTPTAQGDAPEGKQVTEDRQVSQGLFFASLVAGGLGLFVGLMLLLGPRGIVLSLGIVATVLAVISLVRAVAPSERWGAVGAVLLGVGTALLGVLVAARG